ncbi:TPA: endonuclease [Patescibacteria group bacterium]|uniref:GIY-YIG catalytic domain protein n=1 Tax=Candidatus Gottesmanbacteria bacterium GW2011_GWA1_43_11 TaxID=1618436 RepID=A0A0G1CDG5_9BACT|nr:MAG: GIY-YIG catalytic domain protein [Candidatus Gottesmanbacteria bacterium GW2011_GWA1_43_11]HCS79022.1 endonuclease [Patescibacteria group bacterium]
MFTVYIIQNEQRKSYTGYTVDINKRLLRHNGELTSKNTSYTKRIGGYWRVIYREDYNTRKEALLRERFLKSGKGREWLKINIEGR